MMRGIAPEDWAWTWLGVFALMSFIFASNALPSWWALLLFALGCVFAYYAIRAAIVRYAKAPRPSRLKRASSGHVKKR